MECKQIAIVNIGWVRLKLLAGRDFQS